MTTETLENTTKTFKFSFPTCTNEELLFKLEVPVEIPYNGSTRELVQRVLNMFHIPVYFEDELNEKLADFVNNETKIFNNSRDEALLNQLKNGELNVEGIVKNWEKQFKENVVEFAEQKGTSDEEVFATAYHKLVHSPALETILQVENSYAKTVSDTLKNRDEDIENLTQRQTKEMDEKIRLLNISTTEEDINELALQHFEQQSLAAGRWGSQLDALCRAQRAHHRAWLMDTLDQYHSTAELDTPSNSPLGTFSPEPATGRLACPAACPRPEESFTIHLGSQLKQTHNVRIVAMDALDLCQIDHHNPTDTSRCLQTSLNLYSSELSACVIIHEVATEGLSRAAASSTEHHFPSVDTQLQRIMEAVKEPAQRRNAAREAREAREAAAAGDGPSPRGGGGGGGRGGGGGGGRGVLRAGDVAVTVHSNLPDVHVAFHLMAADAALKAGDISSRHPALLGLRNVLKACAANDIASVAIPLLLRHQLSEETTAAWCLRRAELVLKCVKGFVLEAGGSGGGGPATLHFLVPPGAAPGLFASLSALLPAVFRLSNPVKAKPAST